MPQRRVRATAPDKESTPVSHFPVETSDRVEATTEPITEIGRTPVADPSPESTRRRRRRKRDDDDDIVVDVAPSPPLIPEGVYTARSTAVEKIPAFGRPMLRLTLEIYCGPYDGTTLHWFAALPEDGKRPRMKSRPKGFSSKFGRAWELAANRRAERGERLSAKMLVGKMYRVLVKTVTQDHEQRPLPQVSRYSVVRGLLDRDEGGSS